MIALDLFCGAGGASMGLHNAGFEVVGVDNRPQPTYPFECHLADAMTFDLRGYDFIWASPPCQGYSHLTPQHAKSRHMKLIAELRERLIAVGTPYCIENVAGARHELRNPMMLCGSMFGLRTQRHRFFETSFSIVAPRLCDHTEISLLVTTASAASRAKRAKLGMAAKSVHNATAAYGIGWMNFAGLREAIPPAYAEYVATHWLTGKQ